ncbi:hypothetical protein PROFUN_12852 [Planoprotostelium fungivorum]|uniref:Uncharacterized protein n=1 Tax=Planoprotostelium fungivorum TaxID=1890364 RepID=A0A2P6N6A4_9EUKA|nr:hypothetical protein PROFUN_12852 [Planoprotostelium fungivorum]
MQMEDSSMVSGPPLRLVMQWIDEMWAQESASVAFDVKEEGSYTMNKELPAFCAEEDFQLLEPLRARQRKSYDGESRFLSPRPVIVVNPVSLQPSLRSKANCLKASPLANCLKTCSVAVRLLDADGSPLNLPEQAHLFGPNGKDTLLSVPHKRTPPISVKLSGKIGLRALRLGFTIDYETEDGEMGQAHMTSNVFHLARERYAGKRVLSHVNMLHRNVKCE